MLQVVHSMYTFHGHQVHLLLDVSGANSALDMLPYVHAVKPKHCTLFDEWLSRIEIRFVPEIICMSAVTYFSHCIRATCTHLLEIAQCRKVSSALKYTYSILPLSNCPLSPGNGQLSKLHVNKAHFYLRSKKKTLNVYQNTLYFLSRRKSSYMPISEK